MKSKRTPNPVDLYVGGRVRLRRVMLNMSQEKLGEQIGITFQQVQKYEKGINRIGASRLQQIAQALEMPVSYFFEGCSIGENVEQSGLAEEGSSQYSSQFPLNLHGTKEALQLNKAFVNIKKQKTRQCIVELVKSLAD